MNRVFGILISSNKHERARKFVSSLCFVYKVVRKKKPSIISNECDNGKGIKNRPFFVKEKIKGERAVNILL